MKKLLLITILFTTFTNFSQTFTSDMTTGGYGRESRFRLPVNHYPRDIKGNPYSQDIFQLGEVTLNKKIKVKLRFDAFNNELEVKFKEKGKIYLLNKDLGNAVYFLNKSYKVYKNSNEKLSFYLTYNQKSKTKLLIEEKKKIIEVNYQNDGYGSNKKPSYTKLRTRYFISFDNKLAIKIPKRKKEFYNLFGDKKNKIKIYVKKNNLKKGDKKDLEKILAYYDTI